MSSTENWDELVEKIREYARADLLRRLRDLQTDA